MQLVVKVLKPN